MAILRDGVLCITSHACAPGNLRVTSFSPMKAAVKTNVPDTALAAHNAMANAIRALSMDAVEKAKSGHPGMPMGMADVATVLFTEFLRYDPKHPHWPDRD